MQRDDVASTLIQRHLAPNAHGDCSYQYGPPSPTKGRSQSGHEPDITSNRRVNCFYSSFNVLHV